MKKFTKREQFEYLEQLAHKIMNAPAFIWRYPEARVSLVEGVRIWTLQFANVYNVDFLSEDVKREAQFNRLYKDNSISLVGILHRALIRTMDVVEVYEEEGVDYIRGRFFTKEEIANLSDEELKQREKRKRLSRKLHKINTSKLFRKIRERESDKNMKKRYEAFDTVLQRSAGDFSELLENIIGKDMDILEFSGGLFFLVQIREDLRSEEDPYRETDNGFIIYELTEEDIED